MCVWRGGGVAPTARSQYGTSAPPVRSQVLSPLAPVALVFAAASESVGAVLGCPVEPAGVGWAVEPSEVGPAVRLVVGVRDLVGLAVGRAVGAFVSAIWVRARALHVRS